MSFQNEAPVKQKMVDKVSTFVIATAVLGPFALPLLWRNPNYRKSTKVLVSIVVILFTLFLVFVAGSYLDKTLADYKQLLEQTQ